jgi:ankyrin repeat protein
LLLENKASYDMEGSFGRTPLEQAAHKGHARVVQLLLKNGAPWKDHKDKLGDNALDLARAQGHTQVEFLLEGRDPMTGEEISKDEEDVDSEPTDL